MVRFSSSLVRGIVLLLICCQFGACTRYYPDADYDRYYKQSNGKEYRNENGYATESGTAADKEEGGEEEEEGKNTKRKADLYGEFAKAVGEETFTIGGLIVSMAAVTVGIIMLLSFGQ